MKNLIFILMLCLCVSTGSAFAAPIPVVVSIAPQKYLVERIGGAAVSVTALVSPGADPHSYEPTPAQMRACATASIYFSIGVPFEAVWLPRISGSASNLRIVSTIKDMQRLSGKDDALRLADLTLLVQARKSNAAQSASASQKNNAEQPALAQKNTPQNAPAPTAPVNNHGDGHDDSGEDPHVWLSPMLVRAMLPIITRELGKAAPEKAAEFRANAHKLSEELRILDEELFDRFRPIPAEKRVFLTFHPAWRYFAHNYELTELAIEVNGKEPGPKTMKAVIDAARTFGVSTIFVEPQFPQATAKAVAANIHARVVVIDPLAEDLPANLRRFADALVISFTQNSPVK